MAEGAPQPKDPRDAMSEAEAQQQELMAQNQKLIDGAFPDKEITVGKTSATIRGLRPGVGIYKDGKHVQDIWMYIGYKPDELLKKVQELGL